MRHTIVIGLLGCACDKKKQMAQLLSAHGGELVSYDKWVQGVYQQEQSILYVDFNENVPLDRIQELRLCNDVDKYVWLDDMAEDVHCRAGLDELEKKRQMFYRKIADQRVVMSVKDNHVEWVGRKIAECIFAYRDFLLIQNGV